MYLGVDYYPEHWDEGLLESDLDNIIELGCNVIRIGEFAWHMMESNEGTYDFSYFDHVIEKAKEKGLKVIFGTPTATMPAWLAKKYPEVLSEFENGNKKIFGGRRQYCFNSKIYYTYSERIIRALAEHYKDEKAIVAWQIDNEFGHETSDVCYCKNCEAAFRDYLRKTYDNDIQKLNETWGTIFWSQTYNDFDEIVQPAPTIPTHNPSLRMDWNRFRHQSVENYAKFQVDLLKEILGEESTIIHDFSGGNFDKHFDFAKVARHLDVVAYNNYPVWGGQREPIPAYEIACGLDVMRGLKGQNFWITEAIMGAQGHDVIGYLPRPNQAKMWSYQGVAHGCESLMYFRYRGATKGAEQYCYGIIDQDNQKKRKFYEVQSFFNDMKKHEAVVKSDVKAEVAVLYDFDSMASFRIQQQSVEMDYKQELYRLYRPFYNRHITMDVIPAEADFSQYRILLVPTMIIYKKEVQERIKDFVNKGGKVIFTFRTALKDVHNNLTLGECNPTYYTDLIGAYVEEIEALQKGQEVPLKGTNDFKGVVGEGGVFRDMLKVTTATPLMTYDDAFYKGFAAVTVNTYGKGEAYYVGCGADAAVMQILADHVLQKSGMKQIIAPEGVEVVKRQVEEEVYYFMMNHTADEKTIGTVTLAPYESRIVQADHLGASIETSITL